MTIRIVLQSVIITSLVGLFGGCVGVRAYEISGVSKDVSTVEMAQALIGKSATITFVDGSMCEGWITQVQDDSLTICLEEPLYTMIVGSGNIYAISIPGCSSCRTAGAAVGALIGIALMIGRESPDQHSGLFVSKAHKAQ